MFSHRVNLLYDLMGNVDAMKNPATFKQHWKQPRALSLQMQGLKEAVASAPVLATLNLDRDFMLYTIASKTTFRSVLAQVRE